MKGIITISGFRFTDNAKIHGDKLLEKSNLASCTGYNLLWLTLLHSSIKMVSQNISYKEISVWTSIAIYCLSHLDRYMFPRCDIVCKSIEQQPSIYPYHECHSSNCFQQTSHCSLCFVMGKYNHKY